MQESHLQPEHTKAIEALV